MITAKQVFRPFQWISAEAALRTIDIKLHDPVFVREHLRGSNKNLSIDFHLHGRLTQSNKNEVIRRLTERPHQTGWDYVTVVNSGEGDYRTELPGVIYISLHTQYDFDSHPNHEEQK